MRDTGYGLTGISIFLGAALFFVGSGSVAMAQPAGLQYAQAASPSDGSQNIDAEARRLSKSLADDSNQGQNQRVAGLFGPSDEEVAARKAAEQREANQDALIRSLNQQVNDLQQTLQQLTGQIEVANHREQELNAKIDRMQKDFEYRLCTIVAQQMGTAGGASGSDNGAGGGLDCGGAGQQQGSAAPPPGGNPQSYAPSNGGQDQTQTHLAPPPGILGTLNEQDLRGDGPRQLTTPASAGNALPAPQSDAPPQLASIQTGGQYQSAMNMLAQARYDEARGAFRSFADSHPDDPLAPQALYWVGDIAYVQKDYSGAARAFAEGIKKYPKSTRAPQSMLKLGQALLAMGQKQEGCTALGALKARYPDAPEAVIKQAHDDRRTSCR